MNSLVRLNLLDWKNLCISAAMHFEIEPAFRSAEKRLRVSRPTLRPPPMRFCSRWLLLFTLQLKYASSPLIQCTASIPMQNENSGDTAEIHDEADDAKRTLYSNFLTKLAELENPEDILEDDGISVADFVAKRAVCFSPPNYFSSLSEIVHLAMIISLNL